MVSDTTDTMTADDIEQKLAQGSGHRRNILGAFKVADGEPLNTSALRERADVPSGSMTHHLDTLEGWGVVEDTGEREYTGGGGRRARVWRLTERGASFIAERPDALTPPESAEAAERVTALENRVDELERETEQRAETIVEMLKVIAGSADTETQQKVREIARGGDL
ncbi:transcriptional regulator [halophilic archaeon]|nr:transcriptional regulator [halophilic archaeon]